MIKIKILVISHNPFSTYQSMGKTFLSLFSAFKKEELCQLYIYPSFPDVDAVNSCYRITDFEAMKAIVPGMHIGGEVSMHEYNGRMLYNKFDEAFYAKKSNDLPLKRIFRDVVWKLSHWYTHKLESWLNKELPDCIFLAPGYAKFIYDIALKISTEKHIPIITYICDDYYFTDIYQTLIGRYQQKLLQEKTRQIIKKSRAMIAISEEIKNRYSEEFLIDCALLMTGSGIRISEPISADQQIKSLSYFGNVGLKREKSLADLGRVLDEINQERNTAYCLKIYTGTKSLAVESVFRDVRSVKLCGFLTGEEFIREFTNADCLVHVESFDGDMIGIVDGSISTKIADSLASGIPLLAYAPSGIASVEHLRRNNCAFIADKQELLKKVVCEMLDNGEKRRSISKNAVCTAKRYHESYGNSVYLKSLIEKVVGA